LSTYDPFDLDRGGDEGFWGTISDINFKSGDYGFEGTIQVLYDEPRAKDDGTLSFGRPIFCKVAGSDQGFQVTDDGAGFTHPDQKKPRANSRWGETMTRISELVSAAGIPLTGEGNQKLVGLRLFWELEEADQPYSFKDKVTGEKKTGKTKGKWMPTEVTIGSTASSNGAGSFDLASLRDQGLTPVLESDLVGAAKTSDSAQAFMAKAVTIVPGDAKAVVGALGTPAFYEALKAQ
jgi:hypothetical protein